ncbi:hypothetical protein Btru_002558 [Bulinus truncatus]|nr:hypothetical protein Btru_002558 [Bulinus truncatus]
MDSVSEELIWQNDKPLEDSAKECTKNSHDKFFEIGQFKSKIPDHHSRHYKRDEDLVKLIQEMAKLTVHIEISNDKQFSTTFGSGFIQRARTQTGTQCPDDNCNQKANSVLHAWGVVTVTTVFHVVKTDLDAKKSLVMINYDSLDAEKLYLTGYKLLETDKESNFDWCALECVTHDVNLIARLIKMIDNYESLQKVTYGRYRGDKQKLTVMVGHPHGGIKKVSFGFTKVKRTLKEVRNTQDWCQYRHTAHSCPGSSGSPVLILGQPLCGYGYWFGHPHNYCGWDRTEKIALTSIGAESVEEGADTVEDV